MKGTVLRKPPRRPNSIHYSKRNENDPHDQENIDLTPPDPKSSSGDAIVHCLLQDIDDRKLILLMSGHPSARSTALMLQALRQQMSVATLDEYVMGALDWMIIHDVLMLKMKKNSLFSRVLQADGVDAREQMARLVNTVASYQMGRNYLTVHHKTLLPCLIAVLRGKRLPSTTHDQLIACVQKMSVRNSSQKELIQSGMLEWAVNHFDQKLNNYAFEYLAALIINLSTNALSHSLITRLADSIANSVSGLISKMSHGQSCFIYNSLVLAILSCSRVRFRAKDTKLLEAIRDRLESRRSCTLCHMHIPYLIAIINQEAEYNRVPQTPTEGDSDKAGNSCEREIDSLDPLRPSTNELSGARLLIRKAFKDHTSDIPNTPVPGQVQLPCKTVGARSASTQVASRIRNGGNLKNGSARKSEPRIGTATSQHTFVIETERRRPIMINIGLSENASEYKKFLDDQEKKREEEERKKKKEKDDKEKERQKALRHIQLTSRKAPSLLRKELSEPSSPLEEKIEKLMSRKTNSRLSMAKKVTSISHQSIAEPKYPSPPLEEKNNNLSSSSETVTLDSYYQNTQNEKTPEDYTSVFGSRPKVARTPEAQSRSFF